jgi:hypothetical protein
MSMGTQQQLESSTPVEETPKQDNKVGEDAKPADEGIKRVNVIFSNQQFQTLRDLADAQHISLSDALRQAINVTKLVVTANEDKDTRILLDKGGKIQELKIVR